MSDDLQTRIEEAVKIREISVRWKTPTRSAQSVARTAATCCECGSSLRKKTAAKLSIARRFNRLDVRPPSRWRALRRSCLPENDRGSAIDVWRRTRSAAGSTAAGKNSLCAAWWRVRYGRRWQEMKTKRRRRIPLPDPHSCSSFQQRTTERKSK